MNGTITINRFQSGDYVRASFRYPVLLCLSVCTGVLLFFTNQTNASPLLADKIITVKVNSSGIITIGRDTVNSDDVAMYIRERLFKSYAGTGKMYDEIKLVLEGEPEEVVVEVVKKEIASGQKKALNELCLEKYKKIYQNLNSRQQSKLKKSYKVLFQTSYS